jgi:hypothetical protein
MPAHTSLVEIISDGWTRRAQASKRACTCPKQKRGIAAAVHIADHPLVSRSVMLLELSVIPLGRGRSISADIVDLVKIIDASIE